MTNKEKITFLKEFRKNISDYLYADVSPGTNDRGNMAFFSFVKTVGKEKFDDLRKKIIQKKKAVQKKLTKACGTKL